MKSRNVTSKTLITGELNSTFLQKPYLIKNTERFSDLLLAVCVLHLSCHHGQELRKVYSSITWLKSKVHSQISEFLICDNGFKSYANWTLLARVNMLMANVAVKCVLTICVHLIDHILQLRSSVGFWPRERMTVPSSFVVMVPSPSLSNNENASLNSGRITRGDKSVFEPHNHKPSLKNHIHQSLFHFSN